MKFKTFLPCPILQPYIKTLAITENSEEKSYKVLPDTAVVIGFQYKGRLSLIAENKKELFLSTSGITGLQDTYRIFKNSTDIGTVLIYFKEGGASSFFKEPIHELFRESLSLDHFMLRSELLLLEEKLQETRSDLTRIAIVEKFLIAKLMPAEKDQLIVEALSLIHKSKGNIRIKELADQLHTSPSPLEKRFRKTIGCSAKKFASIVRLKTVMQNYKPGNSLTELGYEAGFYDQSHFIKEFKTFTGDTPENYFGGK